MKLHIGCGKRIINGWTNVDLDPTNKPDIIDDAEVLNKIDDVSVDILYASHVLEHFKRIDTLKVLQLWHSKLKSGGVLRLAVPDFEKVVQAYTSRGIPLQTLMGFLVGGQRNDLDNHYMVFDFNLLGSLLKKAGFVDIKKYHWEETEHFYVDDYASCYLPHMDKGSGLLMSLNVEAKKL